MAQPWLDLPIGASTMPRPVQPRYAVPCMDAPVSMSFVYIAFDTLHLSGEYRQPSELILYEDTTLEFIGANGARSGRHGDWQAFIRRPDDEHVVTIWMNWQGNNNNIVPKMFLQTQTHRHVWRAVAQTLSQAAVMIEKGYSDVTNGIVIQQ